MKRKVIAAIAIALTVVSLMGCGTIHQKYAKDEKQINDRFEVIEYISNFWDGYLYIAYDKDTKVEYYIVKDGYKFGISPIYDSNGQVKIYQNE